MLVRNLSWYAGQQLAGNFVLFFGALTPVHETKFAHLMCSSDVQQLLPTEEGIRRAEALLASTRKARRPVGGVGPSALEMLPEAVTLALQLLLSERSPAGGSGAAVACRILAAVVVRFERRTH
ncbi:hypothetical protein [Endothiovibrio diazotrophicus]